MQAEATRSTSEHDLRRAMRKEFDEWRTAEKLAAAVREIAAQKGADDQPTVREMICCCERLARMRGQDYELARSAYETAVWERKQAQMSCRREGAAAC